MNTTAVIYARVSSTNERQNTERQITDLELYARTMNLKIEARYEEKISGAKRNNERPVLTECLEFCFENNIGTLLISELSRLGRNVDEVLKNVMECKQRRLNIHFQKEQLSIFDNDGNEHPFLTIFIAVLGTCAQLERENIKFRLNSGRANYIAKGGRLGRKKGSVKSEEQKKEQYRNVIALLKRGYSVRNIAKIEKVGISTVQRVRKQFINETQNA